MLTIISKLDDAVVTYRRRVLLVFLISETAFSFFFCAMKLKFGLVESKTSDGIQEQNRVAWKVPRHRTWVLSEFQQRKGSGTSASPRSWSDGVSQRLKAQNVESLVECHQSTGVNLTSISGCGVDLSR